MKVKFFKDAGAFRAWLAAHGSAETELWVGFYKKASGRTGLSYQEALDEALCAGWIDGLKKRLDEVSYVHRFTPRKPKSTWSEVNLRRMRALQKAGRVTTAGRRVFDDRDRAASGYSYETRPQQFDAALLRRFRARATAWAFFTAQPPGYQRLAIHFVQSAKQDATRLRRLDRLIAVSENRTRFDAMAPAGAPR